MPMSNNANSEGPSIYSQSAPPWLLRTEVPASVIERSSYSRGKAIMCTAFLFASLLQESMSARQSETACSASELTVALMP